MNYDVELINEKLKDGMSLNSLSKEFGRDRKTIKNNLKKLGYEYNNELHQFVAVNITDKKDFDIESIEHRLSILENKLESINIGNSNDNSFILDSRALKNDIKTRSIKVSSSAIDAFSKLCESKLGMYSKQDLISQALLEFVDRYK